MATKNTYRKQKNFELQSISSGKSTAELCDCGQEVKMTECDLLGKTPTPFWPMGTWRGDFLRKRRFYKKVEKQQVHNTHTDKNETSESDASFL